MAAGNAANSTSVTPATEEAAAKVVQKRFEGLAMVRSKAVKGKGAWYWAHLEPLLIHHADSGLPKAVKLKCRLCAAVFSASNPSRTASEHLKRGTCSNFSATPNPLTTLPPPPPSAGAAGAAAGEPSYCQEVAFPHSPASFPALVSPSTAIVVATGGGGDSSAFSGGNSGKDDLAHLAMFEDSVKRLKSPKSSPGPELKKPQIDFALNLLHDWVYESCGSVSFSSLDHPKFKAFLTHLGLPPLSRTSLYGSRLDSKYEQAKNEVEARIRDAMFFQISCIVWKHENLIHLIVNLPNGTSVYHKAIFTSCAQIPSSYVEEVLWDSIDEVCVNSLQQCVGIVSDRFKGKALRSLEGQHPWMVNLCCQYKGFMSLVKDMYKHLPLFGNVVERCVKLANFVNSKTQVRSIFRRHQMHEYGFSVLLRVPESDQMMRFDSVFGVVEDVIGSARAIQALLVDEAYKMVYVEDPVDVGFWNDLEAVRCVVRLIKEMAHEIEAERPLIGQCLPLWDELRLKLKDWCVKFRVSENCVEKIFERRFKKCYHPAWATSYILDPLYLIRDASGKFLPPFKHLTPQQEKDVDKLITRLVPREEAHIVLMELMKWRSEGLDPVYARAVQLKHRDPTSGKMKIANPQSSRLVWETYLTDFKSLRKIAVRLIFLHATSCGFKCNSNFVRWVREIGHSRARLDKAQKMIFIAAHSKLTRREFSSEDEKDAELFSENGEDDVMNEVFVDASSI